MQSDTCRLPLRNLPEGRNHELFSLDASFFEEHPIAGLEACEVEVNVFFEVNDTVATGFIELEGTGQMECDRCLDLCGLEFESDVDFTVFIGTEKSESQNADIAFYVKDDAEFCDLTDLVLDEIKLALPVRHTHGEDEEGNPLCSNDVSDLLDVYGVKDDKKDDNDPRWDGLKNIKFN